MVLASDGLLTGPAVRFAAGPGHGAGRSVVTPSARQSLHLGFGLDFVVVISIPSVVVVN